MLENVLSIAIGVANLAVVTVLALHARRVDMRLPLPLVVLAIVFVLRAVARLVSPFSVDPAQLTLLVDGALLVVLVMLASTARRLVTSFVAERDAALRARVDYDEALVHHEAAVATRIERDLVALEQALDAAGRTQGDAERSTALAAANAAMYALRDDLVPLHEEPTNKLDRK